MKYIENTASLMEYFRQQFISNLSDGSEWKLVNWWSYFSSCMKLFSFSLLHTTLTYQVSSSMGLKCLWHVLNSSAFIIIMLIFYTFCCVSSYERHLATITGSSFDSRTNPRWCWTLPLTSNIVCDVMAFWWLDTRLMTSHNIGDNIYFQFPQWRLGHF